MGTAPLARAQRRTRRAGSSLAGSLSCNARSRPLEDGLATFGHYRSRRSCACGTLWCCVNRTWSSLRNDQPTRRSRWTLRCCWFGDSRRRSGGGRCFSGCFSPLRTRRLRRNGRSIKRRFDRLRRSWRDCDSNPLLSNYFRGLVRFFYRRSHNCSLWRCRGFRWNNYRRWRTHNSLRRDEAWCRLGRLNWSNWRRASSQDWRLYRCARRTRRHRRRRSH